MRENVKRSVLGALRKMDKSVGFTTKQLFMEMETIHTDYSKIRPHICYWLSFFVDVNMLKRVSRGVYQIVNVEQNIPFCRVNYKAVADAAHAMFKENGASFCIDSNLVDDLAIALSNSGYQGLEVRIQWIKRRNNA